MDEDQQEEEFYKEENKFILLNIYKITGICLYLMHTFVAPYSKIFFWCYWFK